ncbi:MAG: hypothetical protein GY785_19460 [Gammaproteobacteria bacterium]|nr:hypothetical protein [Gammaproteobacteria bacterium]
MKFFKNLNKKSLAVTLVKEGMVNRESVSIKEVADCVYLLANNTGEAWKSASKEAAAGMVLIVLAKNSDLKNYLNATGWKLVVSFIKTKPDIARNISPRTMGEILSYQLATREPMLASFA